MLTVIAQSSLSTVADSKDKIKKAEFDLNFVLFLKMD